MNIEKIKEAINLFPDGIDFSVNYVPNSYDNGAPKNPIFCYILVGDFELEPEVQKRLFELGWKSEDDGYKWLLYF